jgi:hypothetical protein
VVVGDEFNSRSEAKPNGGIFMKALRSQIWLAVAGLVVGLLHIGVQAQDSVEEQLKKLEYRVAALEATIKPETYTTTINGKAGHVFTKVNDSKLGWSWRDESGMLWGPALAGEYMNVLLNKDMERIDEVGFPVGWGDSIKNDVIQYSPAVLACNDGTRLPSKADFERLQGYFEKTTRNDEKIRLTAQGLSDLYVIMPELKTRWFWSLSAHRLPLMAYGFTSHANDRRDHIDVAFRDKRGSVRCVR